MINLWQILTSEVIGFGRYGEAVAKKPSMDPYPYAYHYERLPMGDVELY